MADKGSRKVAKTAKSLERLSIEYVPIDSINANDYNPNRQDDRHFEMLVKSIEEDGFTQPIIAIRSSRTIVDGEHRWRAASHMGMETVPVAFVDMSPEQARIATLRHNRARGEEDVELTAAIFRDLEKLGALEWAADSLILSDRDLERILDDIPAPQLQAGDEFSEAWEPASGRLDERTTTEASEFTGSRGEQTMTAATPAALTALRERESQLAAAASPAEREAIRREATGIYRLSLTFTGAEASLIRTALGKNPAAQLVAILQSRSAN